MHKSDLLTYSRFTRMPTTDEGPDVLRSGCTLSPISFGCLDPSQVLVLELVLPRDQSPPSALLFNAGLGHQSCDSE